MTEVVKTKRAGGIYEGVGGLILSIGLLAFVASIFVGKFTVLAAVVALVGLGVFVYGRIQ